MSSKLQYGYPQVPKSITNPQVYEKDALDNVSPMSFLAFIKNIALSLEPQVLQVFYSEYLKRWNLKKTNSSQLDEDVIVERYRDFIRDVNVNYTTLEERDFLAKIDFNDPYDLDTVLGFYSKKLVSISRYYSSKRNDLKYEVIRQKLKGSVIGTQKILFEKTIQFLENRDNGLLDYDLDAIKSRLKIDVQELYNSYGEYFNQSPNEYVYDYKDLDYDQTIFLKDNQSLISSVFKGVSDEIKALKEADVLFDSKRLLTKKTMGSDFYYLSTGSTATDFISGKLFDATNPSANILNRSYPSTASTLKGTLLNNQEVGFFKPNKTSIIFIDGKNSTFSVNLENLQPNMLYYFPDPTIFGSNSEVLTFYVDESFLKRNRSSSESVAQPTTTKIDTKYYGYVTESTDDFDRTFESIFESGFVDDQKQDIYGNSFGLFKVDSNFKSTIQLRDPNTIKSLILNGHQFYDSIYGEEFNFDYYQYDNTTFKETLRSGLSSYTNSFSSISSAWTLFFRFFRPYEELKAPTENNIAPSFEIRDGGLFMRNDSTFLTDPISADLGELEFPTTALYYYSLLYEGGVHSKDTAQRALLDPLFPTLTANFTENIRANITNDFENIDGGKFKTKFEYDFEYNKIKYKYLNESFNHSSYIVDSLSSNNYNDRLYLNGNIFVRNVVTRTVNPLLTEFSYISSKYSSAVISQLSSVNKFEICFDTISIETPNYLVFEKIKFENSNFQNPKTGAYVVNHNTNNINQLSNRFKVGNDIMYCVLNSDTIPITSNNCIIYPEIYKFDTLENTNIKIFPLNDTDVAFKTEFFSISGGNVRFEILEKPVLTHNSNSDVYSITFLMKDQNEMLAFNEYEFILDPQVSFTKHNVYYSNFESFSNIFKSDYNTLLDVYLSAAPVTVINEELIL